ncbi:MAG: hypothetical protein LKI94_02415 [Sporolactobacillus sp.]|jgi:hypothetical protein|nr:hypothetical protein [Sporolactobacillus sp.]
MIRHKWFGLGLLLALCGLLLLTDVGPVTETTALVIFTAGLGLIAAAELFARHNPQRKNKR